MANKNVALNTAAKAKKDEFYTQLTDIEKEMRHYRKHFKDKIVLCNCDDPFESNFFKYFVLNFNRLKLKKLICTCYSGSPIANKEISLFDEDNKPKNTPYKAIVTTVYDKTGDGSIDMEDIKELFRSGENELTALDGNGDFASEECLELMDKSDIVVTNPPFSQFRKYVATLIEHEKNFIIIGNQNAITYKEIFPLIKDNKMWLGYGFNRNCAHFISPYQDTASDLDHKEGMIRVSGVMWYTNLDIKKLHEEVVLIKKYNKEDYPSYDNYDAIEVSKSVDIPCDYAGVMGVPITFLSKYSPDQFDIIGFAGGWNGKSPLITKKYPQIQIQHDKNGTTKNVGKMNDGTASIRVSEKPHNTTYYTVDDGYYYLRTYARILIRNKHPESPQEV